MRFNTLRNRKTGQESSTYINPGVVPQTLFNKPTSKVDEYTSFLKAFDTYIEQSKTQNPDLPRDRDGNTIYDLARKDMLNNLNTLADVKNAGEIMFKLSILQNKGSSLNDKDKMEIITLTNRLNQIIAKQSTKAKDDSYSISSFLQIMGKNLAYAALDNVLPGSSVLIPLALTMAATGVAAQESACPSGNWTLHGGKPEGGKNMCSSFSGPENYCRQGYLTCDGLPWSPEYPQYSFGAQPSNDVLGAAGAAITLDKCIKADKVGYVVRDIMVSAGNSTQAIDPLSKCAITLPTWKGFQTTVSATLPSSECASFSAAGSAVGQSCQSNSSALKWDWVIGGSIVGGFIVIACMCAGAYWCIQNDVCDDCTCPPRNPC